MTSDILKRAAEAALLPCPFCGRAAHLRDDASHSTAAFIGCETEGCFGYMLWAETATDAAREWNQRPDMAAAIAERDAEIERLTARAEAAEAMVAGVAGMVSIIEGIDGAMNHGVWRDERGMRLKDTPEWARLYVAYAAHAAMKEGTSTLSPIAAAARVLLADPDTFDGFNGYILNRHDMDATMSDYAEGAMDYLRAIAEQEKADE